MTVAYDLLLDAFEDLDHRIAGRIQQHITTTVDKIAPATLRDYSEIIGHIEQRTASRSMRAQQRQFQEAFAAGKVPANFLGGIPYDPRLGGPVEPVVGQVPTYTDGFDANPGSVRPGSDQPPDRESEGEQLSLPGLDAGAEVPAAA